ncbi:hypothetical protein [Pyxidicoccus trucidator]|uniref:hypothetical protein n=1 Tax=Pyxidicoccus trucidator TaxID=2709662 RepID=UPI0013DB82F7|nr:hypothetical protein [Pyxidicoccus trucidator]
MDFGLYGTSPALFEEVFQPERYSEGLSHSVSLEATHTLLHGVEDLGVTESGFPLMRPRSIRTNRVALDARLRWNRLRLHGLGLVRSAGAVVQEDADLWTEFFRGTRRRPELGLSLGADYHLPSHGLTPGLGVRVLSPAGLFEKPDAGRPGLQPARPGALLTAHGGPGGGLPLRTPR